MGRHGPTVSHFMFVDNLLLYGRAIEGQMTCVLNTIVSKSNLIQ